MFVINYIYPVVWWGTPSTADHQNASTPNFSAPLQHNILERASVRSIEQRERYKAYRN